MKKPLLIVLTVLIMFQVSVVFCAGTSDSAKAQESDQSPELTIYAYDSFVSDWGPGPYTVEAFEQVSGIKVNLISAGDSGQVLQRAILEKNSPKADIIIGIDNNMLFKALEEGVLEPYQSPLLHAVPDELLIDDEGYITPYDFGYFSFIYNTESDVPPPGSFNDLLDPIYEKSVIVMDPRTSSPGLGLLHWTIALFGDDYAKFWDQFRRSILTVTDGWDTGYGLFTSGEAPIVLSYTTSPAYHAEYETAGLYEALIFEEGHYMQVEGAGIIKGTDNREAAELFIDFLLSEGFQENIPLTNWMYPVIPNTQLPDSYAYAPKSSTSLTLRPQDIADNLDARLAGWANVMMGK